MYDSTQPEPGYRGIHVLTYFTQRLFRLHGTTPFPLPLLPLPVMLVPTQVRTRPRPDLTSLYSVESDTSEGPSPTDGPNLPKDMV